jgi:hypothetical protein
VDGDGALAQAAADKDTPMISVRSTSDFTVNTTPHPTLYFVGCVLSRRL